MFAFDQWQVWIMIFMVVGLVVVLLVKLDNKTRQQVRDECHTCFYKDVPNASCFLFEGLPYQKYGPRALLLHPDWLDTMGYLRDMNGGNRVVTVSHSETALFKGPWPDILPGVQSRLKFAHFEQE